MKPNIKSRMNRESQNNYRDSFHSLTRNAKGWMYKIFIRKAQTFLMKAIQSLDLYLEKQLIHNKLTTIKIRSMNFSKKTT